MHSSIRFDQNLNSSSNQLLTPSYASENENASATNIQFQEQKKLMMVQLQKLEVMDKIAPLENSHIQQQKQKEARMSSMVLSRRIKKMYAQPEPEQPLESEKKLNTLGDTDTAASRMIKKNSHGTTNDDMSEQFQPEKAENKQKMVRLMKPFLERVIEKSLKNTTENQSEREESHMSHDEIKESENVLDFTPKDFEYLRYTLKQQEQLAMEDISQAKQEMKNNHLFDGQLRMKWDKVRRKLRLVGQVKRLYDDVKLFGTSCRVETSVKRNEVIEELEQILNKQNAQIERNSLSKKPKPRWIIMPESTIKNIWSNVLTFLFIYTAFVTPVRITFVDEIDVTWLVMDSLIDSLFLIDIFVNFFSAYFDSHGELIVDRRTIIQNYLTGWFLIDLMPIFPFDLVLGNNFDSYGDNTNNHYSGYFKISRLPRLYRLVRIARMTKAVKKLKKKEFIEMIQDALQINTALMRVLKFLFTVIICVHIMGCFWYYSAKLYNFQPNTWVAKNNSVDESKWMLYLKSIYWAVTTIATVGFGDIHAYNELEMMLSIFWMIFGVGFYSFTVSSLSTLLGTLDTRSSHLQNKITFMDEFCTETQLPKYMKEKIRRVLEYNSLVHVFSSTERDEILLDIPTHLKFQIAQAMYNGLKSRVSFFAEKDPVFISTFVPKLQPIKVHTGEFIYQKGEYPHQVYFIVNGRVNMVIGVHAITFKTYVSGSYFGEIEVFDNSSRLHTARAEVECDLLAIEYDMFRKILKQFPEYLEEVQRTSLEKLKRERESIEKLQELTGLSQRSIFFRKKRAQSMYKSIKQRKPVELIKIEEEESIDGDRRGRVRGRRSMSEIIRKNKLTEGKRSKSARQLRILKQRLPLSQKVLGTNESEQNKETDGDQKQPSPPKSRSPQRTRTHEIETFSQVKINEPIIAISPPEGNRNNHQTTKEKLSHILNSPDGQDSSQAVNQDDQDQGANQLNNMRRSRNKGTPKRAGQPTPNRQRLNELAILNKLQKDIQRQIQESRQPHKAAITTHEKLNQIEETLRGILFQLKQKKPRKTAKIEFRVTKPEPAWRTIRAISQEDEEDFLLRDY